MMPPSVGFGLFLLLVLSIIILVIFVVCSYLFYSLDSSCPSTLFGHLYSLKFFFLSLTCPLVWGVILAKIIFLKKNILGSKGDCKEFSKKNM
jgi:hypothetical protein